MDQCAGEAATPLLVLDHRGSVYLGHCAVVYTAADLPFYNSMSNTRALQAQEHGFVSS